MITFLWLAKHGRVLNDHKCLDGWRDVTFELDGGVRAHARVDFAGNVTSIDIRIKTTKLDLQGIASMEKLKPVLDGLPSEVTVSVSAKPENPAAAAFCEMMADPLNKSEMEKLGISDRQLLFVYSMGWVAGRYDGRREEALANGA